MLASSLQESPSGAAQESTEDDSPAVHAELESSSQPADARPMEPSATGNGNGNGAGTRPRSPSASPRPTDAHKPGEVYQARPVATSPQLVPSVLLLHTGGTLGMDVEKSYETDSAGLHVRKGTGGRYKGALGPGEILSNIFAVVPELATFASPLNLKVVFNKDSCRVGPQEWIQLARILNRERDNYDAFVVVHGTDTMSYTAAALSLMLAGFVKPIIITGSQLPLSMPRSDARQNLIDSMTCAVSGFSPPHHVELQEVAVCFGGRLMRGNRCQKANSSHYQAFASPTYPHLADLGVDVDWNRDFLLAPQPVYTPRLRLNPNVMRVPIVPGCDPQTAYGDLAARGVRGVVLEVFGVGNMPDSQSAGWLPWLKEQTVAGVKFYMITQCTQGVLQPHLYHSGSVAMALGVQAGPQMTPECAVVKMMLCLEHPDLPMGVPLAGEM